MFTFYCEETHDKKEQRAMIERELEKFLERGGEIEVLPSPTCDMILRRKKAQADRRDKKNGPGLLWGKGKAA